MSERHCRFAGTFFPADARVLAAEVEACLQAAGEAGAAPPCAIVSAHAGYAYSGRFAGLSFASVTWTPARVVVVSPSHRYWFRGLAFPSQDVFATPLGPLAIDRRACAALADAGLAHQEDAAHDNEHGIETQLPFIRSLWPEARLVPLVCGDVPATQVAAALDALADPDTLTVLSSDLSHFLTQDEATRKDAETARLIETGEAEALRPDNACGATGLRGWLLSEAGQGARALRLGMGDSAAVTGDRDRVVGYGAWAFYPSGAAMLTHGARSTLLGIARDAIRTRLIGGRAAPHAESNLTPLQTFAASFVTLTEAGALRGCIGSLTPHRPLVEDVVENALRAGFHDPRFPPVTAELLDRLRISISVLGRPKPLRCADEAEALARITPGKDGLILSSGGRRGVFLPSVWETLADPRAFLEGLKRKAGLPPDHWGRDYVLETFRVESFAEPGPAMS
ncbi:AmmeMemoRadiSam system protein B [Tropicimonas sp. IMCC6043]|uniref:AmmeMemoRadiSam system protein B n=1 Tax=Tropicimonas sp. IMCC6043 TaxID=2510645 RepID=UPI0013E9B7FA|nr:AmmeMemoRadiSam system protein B [Tropicimonas sp. IMCC6043]